MKKKEVREKLQQESLLKATLSCAPPAQRREVNKKEKEEKIFSAIIKCGNHMAVLNAYFKLSYSRTRCSQNKVLCKLWNIEALQKVENNVKG